MKRTVQNEPFAAYMLLAPSRTALDLQQACARAIEVVEAQQKIKKE